MSRVYLDIHYMQQHIVKHYHSNCRTLQIAFKSWVELVLCRGIPIPLDPWLRPLPLKHLYSCWRYEYNCECDHEYLKNVVFCRVWKSSQVQFFDPEINDYNWKSSCFQLQFSWVAVLFQFLQLDLQSPVSWWFPAVLHLLLMTFLSDHFKVCVRVVEGDKGNILI